MTGNDHYPPGWVAVILLGFVLTIAATTITCTWLLTR